MWKYIVSQSLSKWHNKERAAGLSAAIFCVDVPHWTKKQKGWVSVLGLQSKSCWCFEFRARYV